VYQALVLSCCGAAVHQRQQPRTPAQVEIDNIVDREIDHTESRRYEFR